MSLIVESETIDCVELIIRDSASVDRSSNELKMDCVLMGE